MFQLPYRRSKNLMKNIDKGSKLQLYYQIKNIINEYIKEKKLKVNNKLQSEKELSNFFKVNILTVRKAIAELLCNEGYNEG